MDARTAVVLRGEAVVTEVAIVEGAASGLEVDDLAPFRLLIEGLRAAF